MPILDFFFKIQEFEEKTFVAESKVKRCYERVRLSDLYPSCAPFSYFILDFLSHEVILV